MRAPLLGGAAPYDFGSLDYSGLWFSENYVYAGSGPSSGELPGTASQGTSAARALTRGLNAPTISGSPVSGYAPIVFNGATTLAGAAISQFVTSPAESGWFLVNVSSIPAGSDYGGSDAYQDAQVFGEGAGYWGVGLRTTGPEVLAWRYPRATPAPFAFGRWNWCGWRRNGTDLDLRVNNGAFVSQLSNAIGSLAAALRLGGAGSAFDYMVTMQFLAGALSKVSFPDSDFDAIYNGCKAKYRAAGLP